MSEAAHGSLARFRPFSDILIGITAEILELIPAFKNPT